MIPAPATLAMLGGGQLGRFFVSAAHELGYRVMVLDPEEGCPAGLIADEQVVAAYDDAEALAYLAKNCVAATTEFENVPATTLEVLAQHMPVYPGAGTVAIAQDRIAEKCFLRDHGFPTTPFFVIHDDSDLAQVSKDLFPAIVKISRFGYDGKGQQRVASLDQAKQALQRFNAPCVIEKMLNLDLEVSLVMARNAAGETACFPVAENQHQHGILDISIVPASASQSLLDRAKQMANQLAEKLDYVGVLTVEFFISDGELLINEIAPRPHNSGHYTIDGCITSQYEQQVRAMCGLPLGATTLHSATVMVNLLGDLWFANDNGHCVDPQWTLLNQIPNLKLHLYAKQVARPGRKMGHFTIIDDNAKNAIKMALTARRTIGVKD